MPLSPRALAGLLAVLLAAPAGAADWPLWRHDARRSATSPQSLPVRLHLQWVRQLPELKPAWPDQAKMQLDTIYRPVVLGHRLFVGSSHDDTVTAYDTASGKE